MAKGFTPMIGLAVVVALALAAVFGAMSLTNPAQAQATPVMVEVYTNHERVEVDLADHLTGTFTDYAADEVAGGGTYSTINAAMNFYDAATGADTRGTLGDAGLTDLQPTADPAVTNFYIGGLAAGLPDGVNEAVFSFRMIGTTAAADDTDPSVVIEVTVKRSVLAEAKTGTTDLDLMLYTRHERKIDLSMFFDEGTGSGKIASYAVTPAEVTDNGLVESASIPAEVSTTMAMESMTMTIMGVAALLPNATDNEDIDLDVTATLVSGATVTATLLVTLAESTAATDEGEDFDDLEIGDGQIVEIALTSSDGSHIYFSDGMGTGAIVEYEAESDSTDVAARVRGDTLRITGREAGGDAEITVTALDDVTGDDPEKTFLVTVESSFVDQPEAPDPVDDSGKATFKSDDGEYPGDTAKGYTVSFEAAEDYTPFDDTIEIMMEDFGVPSSIIASRVTINNGGGPVNPTDVTVDGTTVTLTVPDFDDSASVEEGIEEEDTVTIVFLATAAIKTPVYSGDYNWVVEGIETVDIEVDGEARPVAPTVPVADGLPSFEAAGDGPGSGTNYTVKFQVESGKSVNTRQNDLVIEFHEDFSVPSSIRNTSVAITTEGGSYERPTGPTTTRTFTPEDVTVDGTEVFISLGDMDEQDDRFDYEVGGGEIITVHFRQSAGISNPTEAGGYGGVVAIAFGDGVDEDNGDEDIDTLELKVPHKVSVDPEDGGLTEVVSVTGKGFKNSTTLTVFLDKKVLVTWDAPDDGDDDMVPLRGGMVEEYDARLAAGMELDPPEHYGNVPMGTIPTEEDDDGTAMFIDDDGYAWAPNRNLDLTDEELCAVDKIGSNDVGKCEFTVTHPTFEGGLNYINAVDGRNNYDLTPVTFELTSSIQASPAGGSPGEIILIQVVDFTAGSSLEKVTLGRQDYCGGDNNPVETSFTCPALTVDSTGSGNFKITVPNWARSGVQELKVFGTGDDDGSQNVTIGGPVINVTPGTVWANQRISLVGTGFSSNAIIGDDDLLEGTDAENDLSKISIGGEVIRRSRISDGEDVEVDSGGNWSASVDLPLSSSTTSDGERVIRVTDSGGRSGTVTVSILPREVTVTPDTGRVGTLAVVRGTGFPSKNDEGSSFNVEIVYDAGNDKEITVSAVPDASGRFEVQLRIPTTAAIPSSNTVKVSFEDDDDVVVVTTVAHDVPEGIITLSNTSGGPGSTVTINGEGFKAFVPVALVKVGTLDVTPAPKPSTDGNGMMSFDVTIPGLDVGIQTIEVNVGRTTSSTGFTVTASGISAGDIKPSAEAVEEMGDNFVRAFNFNNDTKTWTFYDPAAGDASTLQNFITGESYWILIKSTQEVILNRETRNLTCVDGNCWNQIVW